MRHDVPSRPHPDPKEVTMKSRMSLIRRAVLILWLASLGISQSSWAETVEKIVPNSAAFTGNTLEIQLQYEDPDNKGKVKVTAVSVTVDPWNPAKEFQLQAQDRKAVAIADAINKAKLNNVTATLVTEDKSKKGKDKRVTVPLVNPFTGQWVWVYGRRIKIDGLAVDPNPKDPKDPPPLVAWLNDKTGELKGSSTTKIPNIKLIEIPVPSTGSMDGKRSGMSSGVDPSGRPSVFSFGIHSDDDNADYVATLAGAADMTDSEILTELASKFNSLCGACGYTAYYNPTTDKLMFDRPLDPNLVFITVDTDTGIQFDMELGVSLDDADMSTTPVEEGFLLRDVLHLTLLAATVNGESASSL
jgi:hypothetical protein